MLVFAVGYLFGGVIFWLNDHRRHPNELGFIENYFVALPLCIIFWPFGVIAGNNRK